MLRRASFRHPLVLSAAYEQIGAEERKRLHRRAAEALRDRGASQWAIAHQLSRPPKELPRLRIVHRLDKETSGLVVFARSALAERELGQQFRRHTVVRRYLAVVPGVFLWQRVRRIRDSRICGVPATHSRIMA